MLVLMGQSVGRLRIYVLHVEKGGSSLTHLPPDFEKLLIHVSAKGSAISGVSSLADRAELWKAG